VSASASQSRPRGGTLRLRGEAEMHPERIMIRRVSARSAVSADPSPRRFPARRGRRRKLGSRAIEDGAVRLSVPRARRGRAARRAHYGGVARRSRRDRAPILGWSSRRSACGGRRGAGAAEHALQARPATCCAPARARAGTVGEFVARYVSVAGERFPTSRARRCAARRRCRRAELERVPRRRASVSRCRSPSARSVAPDDLSTCLRPARRGRRR
jgi:hypothetical protein